MKQARDEKEIEKVREKILEAGLDIIVKKGLDSLTMRQLAAMLGMTAPNLYNYFTSKDEIYISIIIRGFRMLYLKMKKAYSGAKGKKEGVRALIDTYMKFGMEKPRYYDIMFTRQTPKYDDYVGTPFEKLSEIELKISMDIAGLAMEAAKDFTAGDNEIQKRVIYIWSLLHGMITLYNSRVVTYVDGRARDVYEELIDELMENLAP